MQTPPTNCPRCNSEQSFAKRKRQTSLSLANVHEVYIRCNMCQWERLLDYTTVEIVGLERKRLKAMRRAAIERGTHGATSLSTAAMLIRLNQQSSDAKFKLQMRVGAAGGG